MGTSKPTKKEKTKATKKASRCSAEQVSSNEAFNRRTQRPLRGAVLAKKTSREQHSESVSDKKEKKKSKASKGSKKDGAERTEAMSSVEKAEALLRGKKVPNSADHAHPDPKPKPKNDEEEPKTVKAPAFASSSPNHPKLVTPPTKDLPPKEPTTPPPIPIPESNSAVTPNSTLSGTDRWPAEQVAKAWLDKNDFLKTKVEYEKIQAMAVDVDKDCKKWKANGKFNQSEDYPALDSNLVTVDPEVYVNMSLVDAGLQRPIMIGQLPVKGTEETFWKVVFEKRILSMHVLASNEETVDFFPLRSNGFTYYGQMWVNNRRVESVNDDVHRFAIEVLPEGCSNSNICNVTLIKNWNVDSVHAKQAVVIKETIELTNFVNGSAKDDNALIVSKNGAGRAGYFAALSAAVYKMDLKVEPSIFDIVKSLRSQRPKVVDSLTQYASLYISMFYYIKRKTARNFDGDKKASTDPHDPICKKAVQLTSMFTTALMAEAAAGNVGKSKIGGK